MPLTIEERRAYVNAYSVRRKCLHTLPRVDTILRYVGGKLNSAERCQLAIETELKYNAVNSTEGIYESDDSDDSNDSDGQPSDSDDPPSNSDGPPPSNSDGPPSNSDDIITSMSSYFDFKIF
jgi:hypothetical protein